MMSTRVLHTRERILDARVNELAPLTQYVVVIQAESKAGKSKPSRPVAFQTAQAYPVPYKRIFSIIEAMGDILRGDIQEWGCKGILEIASEHKHWVTPLAQTGALPLIVRAMYAYPGSVNIARVGDECLRIICDPSLPDAGLLSIKSSSEVYDLLIQMQKLPWRADTNSTAKKILHAYDKQYMRSYSPRGSPREESAQTKEGANDRIHRQLSEALDRDPRQHFQEFEQGHLYKSENLINHSHNINVNPFEKIEEDDMVIMEEE